MPNRAFIDANDFIEVVLEGDQTAETIADSVRQAKVCAKKLSLAKKPINMLFDFGAIGKTTLDARRRSVKAMGEIPYHKMAGINASPLIAFISNSVALVTGNAYRTRHFKDRAQAERWLREE